MIKSAIRMWERGLLLEINLFTHQRQLGMSNKKRIVQSRRTMNRPQLNE